MDGNLHNIEGASGMDETFDLEDKTPTEDKKSGEEVEEIFSSTKDSSSEEMPADGDRQLKAPKGKHGGTKGWEAPELGDEDGSFMTRNEQAKARKQ
ncbi:hypothetical protein A2415_05175 [candidate division WWE3 bacterium RIFOXYC1_FULL_39_7]|uniref:Uncharacterized protein n=2 Tax=Katanobacteria TaxID=422282 RepID=A0A1F4X8G7_UNCKA|nr:MAG: hypothetical protein A2415_05175 [candidate division WWE3 bacterium RIFOXYC1_FULL_39_7]OGC77962.1 MAG: hypothetical protein A2619_00685 [candidate division WWE3 bacterium RIFOXYD1_FULL_39_9]